MSVKNVLHEVMLLLLKVTGISEDQLLVTVLPGLPTTAEVFIVPDKRSRHRVGDEEWGHLDQVSSCKNFLTTSCIHSLQRGRAEKVKVSGGNIPLGYFPQFRISRNTAESASAV